MGIFITLYKMDNLVKESKKYGTYHNKLTNQTYPKIIVISTEEIINGSRMNLPLNSEVLKRATKKAKIGDEQPVLL